MKYHVRNGCKAHARDCRRGALYVNKCILRVRLEVLTKYCTEAGHIRRLHAVGVPHQVSVDSSKCPQDSGYALPNVVAGLTLGW
jgi:hypothetical protein